jgi:hypothetical protein
MPDTNTALWARELPPPEVLRSLLDYNPETGELRWKVNRSQRVKAGDIAGYTHYGYRKIGILGFHYFAHRVIYSLYHGCEVPTDAMIDHLNGNPCDNRISNLRIATCSENCLNISRKRNNRSGHTGIGWMVANEKWRARVTIGGTQHYLGLFDTKEEAIAARERAEQEHHIYTRGSTNV